ncbi:hypothetical protein ACGFNP_39350 [Nonomuraea sp. NPDC049269]|uniref:hypothetical protein n=1 Tax=Nonomuraea sp. NPDC049269 TaxID=3364349 RepID=UPI003716FA32
MRYGICADTEIVAPVRWIVEEARMRAMISCEWFGALADDLAQEVVLAARILHRSPRAAAVDGNLDGELPHAPAAGSRPVQGGGRRLDGLLPHVPQPAVSRARAATASIRRPWAIRSQAKAGIT